MSSSDSAPQPTASPQLPTAASLGAPPPPTMAAKAKQMVAKRKEDTAKPRMSPRLLLLASQGDYDKITDHILNMEAAAPATRSSERSSSAGDVSNTAMATQQKASGTAAKEEGACHCPSPSADSSPLDLELEEVTVEANPAIPTMAIQQASGDDEHQSCLDLERVTIEGDTALHVLASCGDDWSYLRSAEIICSKAPNLLLVQNNKGGTPLHCAVRAGNSQMVSCLIDLANIPRTNLQVAARLKELLRKETAFLPLHDAIRIGNKGIITKLLEFDPELASSPTDETGISPLYLAIVLQRVDIAKLLHQMSQGNLSYSGPNGQTALHVAVLQGKVMTERLLEMNKHLAEQADENGSTPLHFAASLLNPQGALLWMSRTPLIPVLLANPVQLYQQDSEGLYPIHVAASSGAIQTIKYLTKERRDEMAGLRDFKGRTLLHVAVERGISNIVEYALRTRSLVRILNMQDNDGNTAMHIAVKNGNKSIFCILLENRKVNLNILNNKGQTPLEIAVSKIPAGFYYGWNPERMILLALTHCNASGCRRVDHFPEKQADEVKESEKLTTSTQTLGIGSVLIVTVTFGTIFAIPGGYKADDHHNGGTPTLAGRYIFHAFTIANTIAFICSSLATINLMYSGMAMVSLPLRCRHFNISLFLAFSSVTSLGLAFTLGMYLVLAPVARLTAIAICAMMMIASLCLYTTDPLNGLRVARALYIRRRKRVLRVISSVLLTRTLITYWPCVVIFGWAAISTKYGHTRHG